MVVLITGASGGLGGAVVKAFLASGAAAVFGVARSWPAGSHTDARFHALTADLTSAEECRRVVDAAGPVDGLIHLLGAFGGGDPVASTNDEAWNQMLDVNLKTSFQMFRAALPGMLAAKGGRILAVGSRAGVEPMPNFAGYSVSKAALIALVRAVAQEVKDANITANIVLPSTIDTPANRAAMPTADASKWVKPESIADLLVWLASEKAGDVNGAVIPIYGKA